MSILARLAALEAFQSAQAATNATVVDAATAAHGAAADVAALGDKLNDFSNNVGGRLDTIEAEIGTEPPAPVVVTEPAPADPTPAAE